MPKPDFFPKLPAHSLKEWIFTNYTDTRIMELFFAYFAASFAGAVVYASFFEWTLHRFVMHRPVGKFDYAFKAHAIVHHHVFKADHTYHLINEKDKETIPMAWWNGPAIILINAIPSAFIAWWVL